LPVAVLASTSKKRSAVLRDDDLECLLQSDSEQSLSDSDFVTENEFEDRALLDTVVNDDSATQDFVWENMENYRGQWENFTGSVGAQGAAKNVDVFELFST
jgi:hypothetical protein